jgi:hypothetical protein
MKAPLRPLDDLLLYRTQPAALGGGRHGHPAVRRALRHHPARVAAACHAGQPGALGSSQRAEHAQLDRARTSKAVSSLVKKGMVSRRQARG